jgi:diphthine-ammonia ligase
MAEISGVTRRGKLISEKKWGSHIAQLKASVGSSIKSKAAAKKLLARQLIEAVEKRAEKKFGILFSGGVDSTLIALICKQLGRKFSCYTVGMKGSKDLVAAKAAAKRLKLRLISKELSISEIESLLKKAARIIPLKDVVTVEVGAVEIAAIELARKHGDNVLFGGLGSEEIFAGYKRHLEAKDANEECWQGLDMMWRRDFLRDCAIASSEKVHLLVPFLDKGLILAAMRIPSKWKISQAEKKIILRETAVDLGLPRQFAFRKKYAAQYGSDFDRAVERLSKSRGFSSKREYIASLS